MQKYIEKTKSPDSQSQEEVSKSVLNKTVRLLLQPDISAHANDKTVDVSGCDFMPGGEVVLCDYKNHTIVVLYSSLSCKETFSFKNAPHPYGVSSVSDKMAVVTLPSAKRLQFIEIKPKLKTVSEVQLDKKCWGINVVDGKIYVSCFDTHLVGRRNGEVRVLNLEGKLIRQFGVNEDGSNMFTHPFDLSVSASSGNVFVSDRWDGTVTCLSSSDGTVVYQFKDGNLSDVRGVFVDAQDNVMVCGRDSNNVLIINAEGKLHASALTTSDGIKSPLCIAYRRSDNIFVVGCENSKHLITMVMAWPKRYWARSVSSVIV